MCSSIKKVRIPGVVFLFARLSIWPPLGTEDCPREQTLARADNSALTDVMDQKELRDLGSAQAALVSVRSSKLLMGPTYSQRCARLSCLRGCLSGELQQLHTRTRLLPLQTAVDTIGTWLTIR
ncbi:hypothetical protein H112_04962 [Trichophyton rubrum D6]|uniref:Uncharacterized protein n=3 Tax=Trichophyton TaxID=5550 RepID=A0A080WFA6_TRIRC|nr:uncharacterized protein TERG_11888 [Trichophyton rubrum CBS 118892]EZF22110.1 hypothetical protein H100_04984 [Trichophyton rubrum MR850]EZF41149.1 hypothetical protein H102_04971 [Trichophyton rubrum CBS 100081]EZF51818.1 hypothetical protein H103_04973 [Trichophyton rubrum CBS 288.86]EZF62347.1 hypothetical protein H104_04965 [Trichophyton rubrum CBS 289.86]EZF73036.1 hypothetical protein H105_04991 [Trichophyton soudanense CBS 452.61]EZF83721.1 hypothetical protein H110_04971 [Trichophy